MSTTQKGKDQYETIGTYGMAEAITIISTWVAGCVMVAFIVGNYHGDQSVSLENAIGYVVIGIVLVDCIVLFRDPIADWIRNRNND